MKKYGWTVVFSAVVSLLCISLYEEFHTMYSSDHVYDGIGGANAQILTEDEEEGIPEALPEEEEEVDLIQDMSQEIMCLEYGMCDQFNQEEEAQ